MPESPIFQAVERPINTEYAGLAFLPCSEDEAYTGFSLPSTRLIHSERSFLEDATARSSVDIPRDIQRTAAGISNALEKRIAQVGSMETLQDELMWYDGMASYLAVSKLVRTIMTSEVDYPPAQPGVETMLVELIEPAPFFSRIHVPASMFAAFCDKPITESTDPQYYRGPGLFVQALNPASSSKAYDHYMLRKHGPLKLDGLVTLTPRLQRSVWAGAFGG